MLSAKMEKALNDQIGREVFSEYLYLTMSAYLDDSDLDGMANFFKIQAQEEHDHMMKFFNYIQDRGGRVKISAMDEPKDDFENPLDVFSKALAHEKYITRNIGDLVVLAKEERDHATESMLQWFIDEQVEEEASMERILNRLKLVDGSGHGLLMIDTELGQRSYVAEGTE
jgi:ferritin